MAIKFQQLTNSVGAAPAAMGAMLDALKALAITHSNWTVVEDTVIGTSNYRWLVFKCAATTTGSQNDFYVAFVFLPSSGALAVYCGEGYTLVSHTLTGVPANGAGMNVARAIGADGRPATPSSVAPSAAGAPTSSGTLTAYFQNGTYAINTAYWFAGFYDDHMAFGVGTSATAITLSCWIGTFNSVVPTPATNDPVRLVQLNLIPQTNPDYDRGAISREPLQFASLSRYGAWVMASQYYYFGNDYDLENARAASTNPKVVDLLTGTFAASRVFLVSALSPNVSGDYRFATQDACTFRGVMANSVKSPAAAAISGIVLGDTVALGGTQWMYVGPNSRNLFIDTGVAA